MTKLPEIVIDPKEAVLYEYCYGTPRNDQDYVVKTSDEICSEGTIKKAGYRTYTEGLTFQRHVIYEGNHFYIYKLNRQ